MARFQDQHASATAPKPSYADADPEKKGDNPLDDDEDWNFGALRNAASGHLGSPSPLAFPAAMNGYVHKKLLSRAFHLGPSADQKLFAVTEHAGIASRTIFEIFEVAGAPGERATSSSSSSSSALSSPRCISRFERGKGMDWVTAKYHYIAIPHWKEAGSDGLAEGESETTVKFKVATREFPVPATAAAGYGTGGEELYHWRNARTGLARALAGNRATYGWELVRGSRRDGKNGAAAAADAEVLAVVCYNTTMSWTKGFKFAFVGRGRTGELGRDWEVATVASALWFWIGVKHGGLPTFEGFSF